MAKAEDLISEISQIMEQYRREVPGKRSRIPESVRERVLALQGLGLNCTEISRRTGIAYFSVLRWKKRRAGFEALRITEVGSRGLIAKADTVAVPRAHRKRRRRPTDTVTVSTSSPTVSVVTASGIRIEGVSVELLFRIVPELGGSR